MKIQKVKMELKDTIELMSSTDYKDRFRAEYWQAKIRCEKLHRMIASYKSGTLDFLPACPITLLKRQESAMEYYIYSLEKRAELEKIELAVKKKG